MCLVLSSEKENGTKQEETNWFDFEHGKRKRKSNPFDFIPFDLILPANLIGLCTPLKNT